MCSSSISNLWHPVSPPTPWRTRLLLFLSPQMVVLREVPLIFPLHAAATLHPPTRTTCLPGPGLPLAFSKRGVCAEQLSCQSRQQCQFCFPDPLPARPPPPSPSEPLSLRNSGQRDDGWRRSLTGKYSIEGVRCAWGHNERIQPGAQYSVWTLRRPSEPPGLRARKKGRQRPRSAAQRSGEAIDEACG